MSFPYKKIAVFGATSGIGYALAERFIENGIFVIAIGRRKERLEELVQKHGHDKIQASEFDVTKFESHAHFVQNITRTHPDLDLVLLNSGLQRGLDFTKPESVDFDKVELEMTTNYLAPVALTKAFLPFFLEQAKNGKHAGIAYTGSGLALVPSFTVPNYSASKAALHSFCLAIRAQLDGTGVKIIEVHPPAVQTELHGEHGKDFGMPLDDFVNEAWDGLTAGKDQVPVGMAAKAFEAFEWKRQELFQGMVAMMKKQSSPTQ